MITYLNARMHDASVAVKVPLTPPDDDDDAGDDKTAISSDALLIIEQTAIP